MKRNAGSCFYDRSMQNSITRKPAVSEWPAKHRHHQLTTMPLASPFETNLDASATKFSENAENKEDRTGKETKNDHWLRLVPGVNELVDSRRLLPAKHQNTTTRVSFHGIQKQQIGQTNETLYTTSGSKITTEKPELQKRARAQRKCTFQSLQSF